MWKNSAKDINSEVLTAYFGGLGFKHDATAWLFSHHFYFSTVTYTDINQEKKRNPDCDTLSKVYNNN